MCHEAHPSLLGLQRWGPTMLPKIHPVPGAFLPTLPTPNLNHSNQLQAHRCNVTPPNVASPNNVSPKNVAPKCGVTGQCGVTKQCGAKQCGAKMWRRRKMWRRQAMWRQTMRRQNVAPQEKCGVTKQCGAKQCSANMWRHNVAPNNVAPHVFEMCLHNVSSASGGKVRALLPTPWKWQRNHRIFISQKGVRQNNKVLWIFFCTLGKKAPPNHHGPRRLKNNDARNARP